ncbi:MAG: rhomboid family intramembrane serine protease [Acidobacteriota bacterium]
MGLADRDYAGGARRSRGSWSGGTDGWSGGGGLGLGGALTPWVKWLLVANFGVFALTGLGIVSYGWAIRNLGFSPVGFWARPWTFVTYMFVHGSFGHVLFNMIALFFFGPPLERVWGGREFLKYYLVCGIGGALASLILVRMVGPAPVIGASGAIFGLLLAFALRWPDARIYIWFLFPVKAKWFVAFLGLTAFWFTLRAGGGGGGVAHWAHLGGLVTGWTWLRWGDRLETAWVRIRRRSRSVGRGGRGPKPVRGEPPPRRRPRRRSDRKEDELDRVDRILDKIRDEGLDALTDEERAFLDEMSRRYRESPPRTH